MRFSGRGTFYFFFVEGATLGLSAKDLSIDCWRQAIVLWRSLVALLTPVAISDLMTAGLIAGS
jgi:hypothetical protein